MHGSNNPIGIDTKGEQDVPFHPYYTVKDMFGLGVFLIVFALFIFFAPNYMGHPDNYIPANALSTPAHIVPEWYFLPFYAILRGAGQLYRRLDHRMARFYNFRSKACRCSGDVRCDRRIICPAMARSVAGPVVAVPAHV